VAGRASRGRGVVAAIAIVLAALLTSSAGIAYWAQRTINDTERYVQTVGPLVDSPAVQAAIVTKVTETLKQQVDVEAILTQVFAGVITDRPRLQALVGPLTGAVDGLIESQVRAFVASDAFAAFWVAANTQLQQALIRALEGGATGALSLKGDQIVLDVSTVVEQVQQRLVDRGLTMLQNVAIPDQGRQIVLMNAPQLERARTIHAVVQPVAQWLIVAVALLYLAGLALSRRRPRMTVIIGALLAANALLLGFALTVGRELFNDSQSHTALAAASTDIYNTLLSFLIRGQGVLLWLGLILMVIGWFLGRNAYGAAVRTRVRGGLEGMGAALPVGAVARPGRWLMGNASWLRVAIAMIGAVVLLWGNNVSKAQLLWSLVVVLVLLAVVQVLVGAGKASKAGRPGRLAGDAQTPTLPATI
jgi:hypothetical protein